MSPHSSVSERLGVAPEELADFCRRWHVAKLEVFGSLLRGELSDADFLVTFEPGKGPAGMDWFAMKEELAQLVGRRVDLLDRQVVEQSRNLYRRYQILRETTAVHEP